MPENHLKVVFLRRTIGNGGTFNIILGHGLLNIAAELIASVTSITPNPKV